MDSRFLINVLVPSLLVPTCLLAVCLNLMVLIVLRCSPRMRSTSNTLVFSLALADLTHVAIFTPSKIVQYLYCKLSAPYKTSGSATFCGLEISARRYPACLQSFSLPFFSMPICSRRLEMGRVGLPRTDVYSGRLFVCDSIHTRADGFEQVPRTLIQEYRFLSHHFFTPKLNHSSLKLENIFPI